MTTTKKTKKKRAGTLTVRVQVFATILFLIVSVNTTYLFFCATNENDGNRLYDAHPMIQHLANHNRPAKTTRTLTRTDDGRDTSRDDSRSNSRSGNTTTTTTTTTTTNKTSLLNCEAYAGGPYDVESLNEMVYWEEITKDWSYQIRLFDVEEKEDGDDNKQQQQKQQEQTKKSPPQHKYLTYDTDLSGFNNQRMVFEVNIAMAIATQRILVLPRPRYIDHISSSQRHSMQEYYDLDQIQQRIAAFQMIRMDEFVRTEGLSATNLNLPTNFTAFTAKQTKKKTTHNSTEDDAALSQYALQFLSNNTDMVEQCSKKTSISASTASFESCSNYTDWIHQRHVVAGQYKYYIDEFFHHHPNISCPSNWGVHNCLVVLPSTTAVSNNDNHSNTTNTKNTTADSRFQSWVDGMMGSHDSAHDVQQWGERRKQYINNPIPVTASASERIHEIYQKRNNGLCIYTQDMYEQDFYHMRDDPTVDQRILGHWYDYLFFENYRHDLWMKRFMRDQLKYKDELQCCAGRIIKALRQQSRTLLPKGKGIYHSMQIRRTDLINAYKNQDVDRTAQDILNNFSLRTNATSTTTTTRKITNKNDDNSKDDDDASNDDDDDNNDDNVAGSRSREQQPEIPIEESIVFIATDEKDKHYFDAMIDAYVRVYFLDDFVHDYCPDIGKDKYGMIDQLVASKGKHFIGQYYSTFTAYINRLRGYHAQKQYRRQHKQQRTEKSEQQHDATNLGIISR